MGKSPAERQREYKQRLKEKGRYKEWQENVKIAKRKERSKARMTKAGSERLKLRSRIHKQAQRKREKLARVQEVNNRGDIAMPYSAFRRRQLYDLNIMEKPEFINCERQWLPDTEESSTYESHDKLDKMINLDDKSQTCPEPEDISSLIKIKEESLNEEIWIKSDPDDQVAVKIEQDADVTTMVEPKDEREISPSTSNQEIERDVSKGVEDELDDISGSRKNENSILPLTASATASVGWKETSRNEPYCCAECKITFKKCETLEKHKLIHSQKPHCCIHCNKTFFLWDHLKRHLKEHRTLVSFRCSICKKSFLRKPRLKAHMATHCHHKLYSCSICGSKFAIKNYVYKHMTIHAEDRKHPCSTCGKKFLRREMRIHKLSHGEKCHDSR